MTPQEFKAWFEGFTEAFAGVPTKAQWARVKERVAEIDGKPITERIYVDRYLPSYPYWYQRYGAAGSATTSLASSNLPQQYAQAVGANNLSNRIGSGGAGYNSLHAMHALGRAEAKAA